MGSDIIRARRWRRLGAILVVAITTAWFQVAAAQTVRVTWTSTADFEDATRATNVNARDVPDELRLNLNAIETPYLWLANSTSDSIAQMRTADGTVRRVVSLDSLGGSANYDPSRTAVDVDFNCWVGNRRNDSIARLGAEDFSLDRVYRRTDVFGIPRGIAINSSGDVWVANWSGGNGAGRINLLDEARPDGGVLVTTAPGQNVYGLTVDALGNLYTSDRGGGFISRYDAETGEFLARYSVGGCDSLYGIAADLDGNLWLGNFSCNDVLFVSRDTLASCSGGRTCSASATRISVGGGGMPRGVTIDRAGDAWVSSWGQNQLVRIDGSTRSIVQRVAVGNGPIGITGDADGFIWAANYYGGGPNYIAHSCPNGFNPNTGGSATKIRSSDGSVVGTYPTCGNNPYTYSDMAGYTLRSVTLRSGWWNSVRDSGVSGIEWDRINWTSRVPPGTRLQIRMRAADARSSLEASPWTPILSPGATLAGISGRWVEIEAFFFTPNDFLGPVIEDVTISSVCRPDPRGEVCDGEDNDCDGTADEPSSDPGVGGGVAPRGPCATGRAGLCDNGIEICDRGTWICTLDHVPVAEVCDGEDNDCDGAVDEGVTNACGTCGPVPTEVCDGEDNDCDGLTDEGVRNRCMNFDTCETFETCDACPPTPPEACDGEDNDCDGLIDEGEVRACVDYRTCELVESCDDECPAAPEEVCDGIDNDCDGLIDEGVLNSCINYADCTSFTSCDACPAEPAEVCDGLDNDCDGDVDEGVTNACGFCGEAPTEVCDGLDNDCDGEIDERVTNRCGFCGPLPDEVCDGLDNDCDGETDEGVANACGTCGPEPLETCDGIDNDCDGSVDEGVTNACGTCGDVPVELCDGLDNDCDGEVDEGTGAECAELADGAICIDGECAPPCTVGECPTGRECVDGFCVSDPCAGVFCADGFSCVEGTCQDDCEVLSVDCSDEEGLVCVRGRCVPDNCESTGCVEGFVCVDNDCVPDPCIEMTCEPGEICTDGVCEPDPCEERTCDDGTRCVDGECVDACEGVVCGRGFLCEDGFCLRDACFDVTCGAGATCVGGNCIEIACVDVTCPDGQVCRGGECLETAAGTACDDDAGCPLGFSCEASVCRPDDGDPLTPGADPGTAEPIDGDKSGSGASSGCATAASTNRGASGWLLLLASIAVARSRRRRRAKDGDELL